MGLEVVYTVYFTGSKKVETVFSIITGRFGNVIKATSIDGFITITAYSMDCFLKLSDDEQMLLAI